MAQGCAWGSRSARQLTNKMTASDSEPYGRLLDRGKSGLTEGSRLS